MDSFCLPAVVTSTSLFGHWNSYSHCPARGCASIKMEQYYNWKCREKHHFTYLVLQHSYSTSWCDLFLGSRSQCQTGNFQPEQAGWFSTKGCQWICSWCVFCCCCSSHLERISNCQDFCNSDALSSVNNSCMLQMQQDRISGCELHIKDCSKLSSSQCAMLQTGWQQTKCFWSRQSIQNAHCSAFNWRTQLNLFLLQCCSWCQQRILHFFPTHPFSIRGPLVVVAPPPPPC